MNGLLLAIDMIGKMSLKARMVIRSIMSDNIQVLKECLAQEQGYQFPNPANIKDPKKSQLVLELVKELKHEEMKITPSGKESFDHPTGRHNDKAIAWELSIRGCLRFMLNANSEPVAFGDNKRYIPDENQGLINELYEDPHITINDTAVRYSNDYNDMAL